jgi:hypothetical protein
VSDLHVWPTRHFAELVKQTLDPLVQHYSDLAQSLGGAPEVLVERAHHIGHAQGLIDAINALVPLLGGVSPAVPERPELADEAPAEWPKVSPTSRVRRNGGRHAAGGS